MFSQTFGLLSRQVNNVAANFEVRSHCCRAYGRAISCTVKVFFINLGGVVARVHHMFSGRRRLVCHSPAVRLCRPGNGIPFVAGTFAFLVSGTLSAEPQKGYPPSSFPSTLPVLVWKPFPWENLRTRLVCSVEPVVFGSA